MVNQSPAAPNGAVPDRGFAALVLPRLFHPPISLSDSLSTAAARLAGGEFKGDRGGRGFGPHPAVPNTASLTVEVAADH